MLLIEKKSVRNLQFKIDQMRFGAKFYLLRLLVNMATRYLHIFARYDVKLFFYYIPLVILLYIEHLTYMTM